MRTLVLVERKRSPIVLPGYRKGQHPANYGLKLPPEPLSRSEVERLLRNLGHGPYGHRNRALIALMWRSGLRISEALALFPKDIDRDAGTVTVLRGKGDKRRQVALDALALELIDRWMAERPALGIGNREPLFCCIHRSTARGRGMSATAVRELLRHARVAARIEKRVHPHGLRHTMAFELLMEKQPLGVIRAQLGHSELGTTMRYLDHLAPAEAIRAMHARPVPSLDLAGLDD